MCQIKLYINEALVSSLVLTEIHCYINMVKGIVHFEIEILYLSAYPKGIKSRKKAAEETVTIKVHLEKTKFYNFTF